ncbi:hypothetical protein COS83_00800 [archaeon CG07_land_8_20_14_0_80_38_8]|nr:MAG: hypothetical protein COS83_00800 [archaeon CG07_land_8_20_14_0_80_38_8]
MKALDVKSLFKLMRPQQWFKSASVLFGVSVLLFNNGLSFDYLWRILLAIVSVLLLSSSVYVLNDIADFEKDKLHPIKKNRPIASSKVSINQALLLFALLFLASFGMLYFLNPFLVLIGSLMIVNNLIYSFRPFRLKDIPVLDVLCAALNFSLRVLIGWYAITDTVIYRIVLLFPFFIAGFLLSCKRLAEYDFLGSRAGEVRRVYKYYSEKSLYVSINVYFTLSILAYYFFADIFNKLLFLIGPWFFLQMYWYKSFLKEGASVVKKPEDVFVQKKFFTIMGGLFCLAWLLIVSFT